MFRSLSRYTRKLKFRNEMCLVLDLVGDVKERINLLKKKKTCKKHDLMRVEEFIKAEHAERSWEKLLLMDMESHAAIDMGELIRML